MQIRVHARRCAGILDDDGNAVLVFKGESCAAGPSAVIADVLAGTHPTYVTIYTVAAPQATFAGARMVAAIKHHRHDAGAKGGTPTPNPPAMTVNAGPGSVVETGLPLPTPAATTD